MKYTEEQVLKIVDSCFHMYASHYRTDARDCAREIMKGMINKELQQANGANTSESKLPLCNVVQRSELLSNFASYLNETYDLNIEIDEQDVESFIKIAL